MEFEVVDGKFVQKQSGESVKPEVLDTLTSALSKTVSNYKNLIEHFSKGLNEVDLSELAPSAVIKVDEVGGVRCVEKTQGDCRQVIIYNVERDEVAKVQQQSEVANKVATSKVGKVARPWNKGIWVGVPALRKEPFGGLTAIEDACRYVWAQDPKKVPRAVVYAFPSRWAARLGQVKEDTPSLVVYNE